MTFDPRLIALFCLFFIILGIFSIISGRKRLQEVRAQGQKVAWYRHISILTGIEYILLAVTFLASTSINAGWLPKSWGSLLVPFYLIMLVASLGLACIVIFQMLRAPRRVAAVPQAVSSNATVNATHVERPVREMTAEEQAEQARKKRERRHKAAVARRRRAGKA